MVVKGSARGGPGDLAKHLEKDENEAVWIAGCKDLAAGEIKGALIEMDALGSGLKTRRTLYHMSINPEPGKDRMTSAEEWDYSCKAALKKMGLEHQPHVIVGHKKIGKDGVLREHRHIIAARTDLDHNRAIRADHNYRKHEEIARELEQYLGHEKVQGVHVDRDGKKRPDRTPSYAEMQQAKRTGISRDAAKALITGLWRTTDSATALQAALDAHGWITARGGKTTAKGRAYLMVIDPQGGAHELARRVDGVKAAQVHERMAGIDPASLPSVAAAKAMQRARQAQRKIQPEPPQQPVAPAPIYDVPDSSKRKKKMASEREDAADPATIKRQIEAQQDFAAQAKEQTELSERFLASVKSAQEEGDRIKAAEAAAGQRAAQDDDIADARSRYAQAAGERYDIRRPYSSLSEVVGLEGAMFQREQEKLRREAAVEQDPEKRELIELRRQIEANDYMAVTSDRLAAMSRIITGNGNSEESQRQEQRAEYFAAEALELRRQRQEAQDRIRERDEAREAEPIQPAPDARLQQQSARAGTRDEMDARHRDEWELVHGAYGVEELPSQLERRQAEERARFEAAQAAPEAAQAPEAARAASAPGQPDKPVSEPERPAEIIYASPARPEPVTQAAAREITDARQAESASAENVEITDAKAAKKAAVAQQRADTEQAIQQGQERGYGHSR